MSSSVTCRVSAGIPQEDGKSIVAIYADQSVVRIMSYSGPFRGVAIGGVAGVTGHVTGGESSATITTAKLWYTDLSRWVPGVSSTIKNYWAKVEVDVVQNEGGVMVGFAVRDLEGNVMFASPPVPLVSGSALISA